MVLEAMKELSYPLKDRERVSEIHGFYCYFWLMLHNYCYRTYFRKFNIQLFRRNQKRYFLIILDCRARAQNLPKSSHTVQILKQQNFTPKKYWYFISTIVLFCSYILPSFFRSVSSKQNSWKLEQIEKKTEIENLLSHWF